MDKKIEQEVKLMEDAGIKVVLTTNDGHLSYVTGGINQDNNFCDSCPNLKFTSDQYSDDFFLKDDSKAVCTLIKAKVRGFIENNSEMIDIKKPLWCPNLGRELTDQEKELAKLRLENDKEDY